MITERELVTWATEFGVNIAFMIVEVNFDFNEYIKKVRFHLITENNSSLIKKNDGVIIDRYEAYLLALELYLYAKTIKDKKIDSPLNDLSHYKKTKFKILLANRLASRTRMKILSNRLIYPLIRINNIILLIGLALNILIL